jgi:hypothetical protein
MGWSALTNGELLKAADAQFDVLITTDQSLRYQQNLEGRRLAILVLSTTSWPKIRRREIEIVAVISSMQPGEVIELNVS